MKLFECDQCGQLLYFENSRCERCGSSLGYDPGQQDLVVLANGETGGASAAYCANSQYAVCNWLVPPGSESPFCQACQLNRMVPDLTLDDNRERWRRLEMAKHRLVYSLLRLGLPVIPKSEDPGMGLAFDFLAGSESYVVTGHEQGLITINIREADDAERESMRHSLGEAYRTLLGHFRHESGHYYWNLLIQNGPCLETFRRLFGNEQTDYSASLNRHYQSGAAAGWQGQFISAYASSHPWEDWAETWAHYLHMVDTLESAYTFGMRVRPKAGNGGDLRAEINFDAYLDVEFDTLIAAWLPLTYAVNSINRSMGHHDLYPFVLAPPVVEKLRFVHGVIRQPR